MPDPPPAAAANYPNAPPPPGSSPPGGYPPPPYATWQGAPAQYRGPILPAWLSFGGILVLVGGILILVGFLVEMIANTTVASATVPSYTNYYNQLAVYDALVGVGIFLAFLGWIFHQMSRHRMMSPMGH